jgi:hypothetical protein
MMIDDDDVVDDDVVVVDEECCQCLFSIVMSSICSVVLCSLFLAQV